RKLTGALASVHFAPTQASRENLFREGVGDEHVVVTGNTVIDALLSVKEKLEASPELGREMAARFPYAQGGRRMVLVTGHRRENFGGGFVRICEALRTLARQFADTDFVYPV